MEPDAGIMVSDIENSAFIVFDLPGLPIPHRFIVI